MSKTTPLSRTEALLESYVPQMFPSVSVDEQQSILSSIKGMLSSVNGMVESSLLGPFTCVPYIELPPVYRPARKKVGKFFPFGDFDYEASPFVQCVEYGIKQLIPQLGFEIANLKFSIKLKIVDMREPCAYFLYPEIDLTDK